jgi:hypothetical protein
MAACVPYHRHKSARAGAQTDISTLNSKLLEQNVEEDFCHQGGEGLLDRTQKSKKKKNTRLNRTI